MGNDINSVLLVGRLVRDPESKQLQSGTSLASFSLASGRSYTFNGEKRDETVFIDCTAWGKLGEVIVKYCTKGKQIAVRGRLKQDVWQGPDGKNRSKISVVVEDMQLLGSGSDRNAGQTGGNAPNYQSAQFEAGNNSSQGADKAGQGSSPNAGQVANSFDGSLGSGGFPDEDEVPF